MKKKAFTLVEMMMVVVILGLLVSLGVPGYLRSRNKSRQDTCINNLRIIEHAADQYRIDTNLGTTISVDIVSLWPSTVGTKDVSSYISKQLSCPVNTNIYVGGDDSTSSGLNSSPSSTTITANGLPHCYDGSGIFQAGSEYEHSIEKEDK